MHHEPPSLKLAIDVVVESSVFDIRPIAKSAPDRVWKFPLIFSLTLTPLVIYGLSSLSFYGSSTQVLHRRVSSSRRSISLVLMESEPRQDTRAPTTNWIGPSGPGGQGHFEGTDTIDRRLVTVKTPIISFPTEAIDPDMLSQSSRAEAISFSVNPALPIQPGGNGLSKGTGKDPARGLGGLWRKQELVTKTTNDKQTKVPDGRLVPIRRQPARHLYKQGDLSDEVAKTPTIVRAIIGENGLVTKVQFISGPEEMRADALWAARLWIFEPLGPHGLHAPLSVDLVFYPRIQ